MSDFPKVWMIFPKYISLKKNLQTNKSFIVLWPVKKLVIKNMNMFLGLGIYFKWKTTKEYQDLYLRCDVLLLFDMFEKSRNNSGKMVYLLGEKLHNEVCVASRKSVQTALCVLVTKEVSLKNPVQYIFLKILLWALVKQYEYCQHTSVFQVAGKNLQQVILYNW